MRKREPYKPSGVEHATINGVRLHLRRTDPCNANFLWINGKSPPLVLDPVAAEMMGFIIKAAWRFRNQPREDRKVRQWIINQMFSLHGNRIALPRQRVTKRRIGEDLDRLFSIVMNIARGSLRVEDIPIDAGLDQAGEMTAPVRMDLAVTYACNEDCDHCYMGGSQHTDQLNIQEWFRVMNLLWEFGVPQVVFSGGEPTLHPNIVQLVSFAERFVTGLITNGSHLERLASELHDASLDYTQVTIHSLDSDIHNAIVKPNGFDGWSSTVAGIRKAVSIGMQICTNTTLRQDTRNGFPDLIRWGADSGLKYMACNALIRSGRAPDVMDDMGIPHDELESLLRNALDLANQLGVKLDWFLPTCYHDLNPIGVGFDRKGCSASSYNMTIHPSGDVLPCQSWATPVGHILNTPWNEIWNHPVCKKLRAHELITTECETCADFSTCGGGCPLERIHGVDRKPVPMTINGSNPS